MSRPIVAGNWKLNKDPRQAKDFYHQLLEVISEDEQCQFMLFPPALVAETTGAILRSTNLRWGGQNVYSQTSGAFTGENSAEVYKQLGADICLVGHSERRQIFGEVDEMLAQKVELLQKLEVCPILCVGETLEEREAEETFQVISRQVAQGLAKVDLKKDFVIAYEPVWAIGTGKVATPEIAEEAHQVIRQVLNQLAGKNKGSQVKILYGGSVKPENAKELFSKPNIDGFLVGGASLEVESFVAIYRNCAGT